MFPGEKKLFVFAGINGAGKTSLYSAIKETTDLGIRVSIDDNAMALGDWRDPVVQVRAGCKALRAMLVHLKNAETVNEETTLPGAVIERQLAEAKKLGYRIILYFVGVEGVELAIERVRRRVERGGHGVPEELIRRRYANMPKALSGVLPLCDLAYFYDNTEMFRQIASSENGVFTDLDADLPEWFYIMTGRSY